MDCIDFEILIASVRTKFEKACWQVRLLNKQLDELETRFKCSNENGNRVYDYNLRLKLCITEGVRNIYYEYAQRMCDKLDALREEEAYSEDAIERIIEEIEVDVLEE